MNIHVHYFARIREITGKNEEMMDIAGEPSGEDVLLMLHKKYPALNGIMKKSRISINCEFGDVTRRLREGDEVALIPPVSGG